MFFYATKIADFGTFNEPISECYLFRMFAEDLVNGAIVSYIGSVFLLMSFCSPYWIESYDESFSSFKNMGLWEYCFKDFYYPYYQFPRKFNGCHNIFSHVSRTFNQNKMLQTSDECTAS